MTKSKVKSRKWIGSSLDGFIFLIVSLNVSIKKNRHIYYFFASKRLLQVFCKLS